ncbi:MAG TPA: DUF1707 domain-containing protein [Streptosporangiaceae bacterium]|nr:DUF1707 domain-containing protein [Streptosporangiaceae bacterium]
MVKPEDPDAEWVAGAGHLRVSDADRERMVDFLKNAFVHGRLSLGELAHRAGQALEARTSAQLADVAADIPARPPAAAPPGQPAPARVPARARPVSRKAIAWVLSMIIVLPGLSAAFVTYYGGFIIVLIVAFFAAGWLDSYDSARVRRHRAY